MPYQYPQHFQPPLYQNQVQTQVAPHREILHVNGRNGAEMMPMAPNSQALLLDDTASIIWLAQTDSAGYKTLSAFDIVPHQEVSAPDFTSLEARISALEERMNESYKSNDGHNKQSASSKKSGEAS